MRGRIYLNKLISRSWHLQDTWDGLIGRGESEERGKRIGRVMHESVLDVGILESSINHLVGILQLLQSHFWRR
jgi:hypothetical protein